MNEPVPGPSPIPEGGILLHVGMNKTGTTAVQGLLAHLRHDLLAHGVWYPADESAHHLQARSVLGLRKGWRRRQALPPDPEIWDEFSAMVRAVPDRRCVISSERFAVADAAHCAKIAADLGPDRLHVIVGARHFALSATSFWQQTLKTGKITGLEDWFRREYERTDANPTPQFWLLQDPSVVAERWVNVLGPDRVHVLVVDEQDRKHAPLAFERLLDLPSGLLTEAAAPTSNRSMTVPEAEFARQTNAALKKQLRWPEYELLVRLAGYSRLVEVRAARSDEQRLQVPRWAADQAVHEGVRVAEAFTRLGVDVIGNLDDLTTALRGDRVCSAPAESPQNVPIDLAVQAMVGPVLTAAHEMRRLQDELKRARAAAARSPRASELTTAQLARLLRDRFRSGVRRRLSGRRSR